MKAWVGFVALALAAVSCGDDLEPPPCQPAPDWADYVVWNSPAEDCTSACGVYFASLKVPSLPEPAAICVFRIPGEWQ